MTVRIQQAALDLLEQMRLDAMLNGDVYAALRKVTKPPSKHLPPDKSNLAHGALFLFTFSLEAVMNRERDIDFDLIETEIKHRCELLYAGWQADNKGGYTKRFSKMGDRVGFLKAIAESGLNTEGSSRIPNLDNGLLVYLAAEDYQALMNLAEGRTTVPVNRSR